MRVTGEASHRAQSAGCLNGPLDTSIRSERGDATPLSVWLGAFLNVSSCSRAAQTTRSKQRMAISVRQRPAAPIPPYVTPLLGWLSESGHDVASTAWSKPERVLQRRRPLGIFDELDETLLESEFASEREAYTTLAATCCKLCRQVRRFREAGRWTSLIYCANFAHGNYCGDTSHQITLIGRSKLLPEFKLFEDS